MAASPLTIKLRCTSWQQLRSIYERDLTRGTLFLRSERPPPIGTEMRIDLTLPSGSVIALTGRISDHLEYDIVQARGPGVDIALDQVPQAAMWLIESALASAAEQAAATAARGQRDAGPDPAAPAAPRARPAAVTQAGSARLPPAVARDAPPSMEAGSDVAEAATGLVAALQQEHAALRRLDPFQVLGVGYDTTDDAVRAAFGELTRRYHPDRFARYQSEEARTCAGEIFILIRDAYRRLGTAEGRARVQQTLEAGRRQPPRAAAPLPEARDRRTTTTIPVTVPLPASGTRATPGRPQVTTTAAVVSARPEPPAARAVAAAPAPTATAAAPSRMAADLLSDVADGPSGADPIELAAPAPPPRAGGGSRREAERLIAAGDHAGALKLYQAAVKRDPRDRIARAGVELAIGLRALAQRNRLEAAQRFEAVLELDPTNERAARELAEMRRIATNERKGLLSRLLGKE
jgi:hypothetical protein